MTVQTSRATMEQAEATMTVRTPRVMMEQAEATMAVRTSRAMMEQAAATTGDAFLGVPTWAWLAGGAAVAAYFAFGRKAT